METAPEREPKEVAGKPKATNWWFWLLLAVVGVLALVLIGLVWQQREQRSGELEVTLPNGDRGEIEFRVVSEMSGLDLSQTPEARGWFDKALTLLGYEEPYEFQIFGSSERVSPKEVKFVFRDLNELTDEEKDKLYHRNIYGGKMIAGLATASEDDEVANTIYLDLEAVLEKRGGGVDEALAYYLFFFLYVTAPDFKYLPEKAGDLAELSSEMETWALPLEVRGQEKAGLESGGVGKLLVGRLLENWFGVRVVEPVFGLTGCDPLGDIECGTVAWGPHCGNASCKDTKQECSSSPTGLCVDEEYCYGGDSVVNYCNSDLIGGTCTNPTCPSGYCYVSGSCASGSSGGEDTCASSCENYTNSKGEPAYRCTGSCTAGKQCKKTSASGCNTQCSDDCCKCVAVDETEPPTCSSFDDFFLKDCTPLSDWNDRTRGCMTGENKADVSMGGVTNATTMRLMEETQGRNCSNIDPSEFGAEMDYSTSYEDFPLSSSLGDKKVCGRFSNSGGSVQCGGKLEIKDPDCQVSLEKTVVADNEEVVINFSGDTYVDGEKVSMNFAKRDWTRIEPPPEGLWEGNYDPYYVYGDDCYNEGAACSGQTRVTLPPGEYYAWCGDFEGDRQCNGSPRCEYHYASITPPPEAPQKSCEGRNQACGEPGDDWVYFEVKERFIRYSSIIK